MRKIDKIKDKFFKKVFSDEKNVKPFLRAILPQPVRDAIDWSKMATDPTNYVSRRFREGYSDMVVKTKIQNAETEELDLDFYLLIEHKSTNEKDTPVQILGYKHLAWDKDSAEGKPLRVIIPVVFYHGREKWTVPLHFVDHFKVPESVIPYLLDFQYILFDTAEWDFNEARHQELKDNVFLLTALAMMKCTQDENWELVREILRFWVEREFIKDTDSVVFFLLFLTETKNLNQGYLEKLLDETQIDGGEIMLNYADQLRKEGKKEGRDEGLKEGRDEGLKEGRDEGRETTLLEVLKNAFIENLPLRTIERLTGLNPEKIKLMKEKIQLT